MKKLFLLLTSALMGVAAIAGPLGVSSKDGKTILTVQWNEYGSGTEWQGGEQNGKLLLQNAFLEYDPSAPSWVPSVGESFFVVMKGVANFTGTISLGTICEEEGLGYWQDLGNFGSAEVSVVAGEEFTAQIALAITTTVATNPDKKEYLDMPLETADLVVMCRMTAEATEAFGTDNPCVITLDQFDIAYEEAGNYENPYILEYKSATTEAFQYQGTDIVKTNATVGQYVNVNVTFTPNKNIKNIQYGLVDNSENAWSKWWGHLTSEENTPITFASEIEKGTSITKKFSLPIVKDPCEGAKIVNCFFAESDAQGATLVLDIKKLEVSVTDKALYAEPTAVEEVSNVTIENGVIYSAGQIVIYNVAGQVVATASQEFAIASLEAGVYFVATAEGTAKIVK